jgi:hypothetical protein
MVYPAKGVTSISAATAERGYSAAMSVIMKQATRTLFCLLDVMGISSPYVWFITSKRA